jgi:photosystem II stability/assembly factor-like uncharacterized protein
MKMKCSLSNLTLIIFIVNYFYNYFIGVSMWKSYTSVIAIIFLLSILANVQTQAQWTEQTSPTANALQSVSVVDNNIAWIGGAVGTVLRTTNGGANWTSVGGGTIGTDDVYNIFGVNDQIALCTTSPGATYIFRTTNGGTTWTQVLAITPTGFMDAIWMFDSNNGFAYGDPVSGNWLLYKTSDGGATWTPAPNLAQSGSEAGWNNAMYVSGSNIYFGTNNTRIYYSSNGGNSWTAQTTTGQVNSYAVWFNDANIGMMGGSTGGLDKTTNGGTTWSALTSPGAVASAGLTGALNQWLFAQQANPGVIYYSTNDGANWTTSYTAPNGQFYHIAKARNGNWVLAVQSDGGISSNSNLIVPVELTSFTAVGNNGVVELNWQTATEVNNQGFEIERRTETSEFRTIGFAEGYGTTTEPRNYVYMDRTAENGTNYYRLKQIDFNGTYAYSDIVEVDVTGPLSFNLAQNYPNPFNPSTSIKYSVPESGSIRLSVYNTVGEEVAVLVNGFSQAGSFEVTFDASNLSTGVYLYKLQSANSIQTKKMMLLK